MFRPIFSLILLLPTIFSSKAQTTHSTSVDNGRLIYEKGKSERNEVIKAYLGQTPVTAAMLPCKNCHGEDGKGRPEGGVIPANITRTYLGKSLKVNGRVRPAYSKIGLIKAITQGFDPAGNKLHQTMPQYALTKADIEDLLAYLNTIEHRDDPGITDSTLYIGLNLPDTSPVYQEAMLGVFNDHFKEVNNLGGIYGRRIEATLLTNQSPETVDKEVLAVTGFIKEAKHEAWLKLSNSTGLPLMGIVADRPRTGFVANKNTYYLEHGLLAQYKAMLAYALKAKPNSRILVLYEDDSRNWLRSEIEGYGKDNEVAVSAVDIRKQSKATLDASALIIPLVKSQTLTALLADPYLQSIKPTLLLTHNTPRRSFAEIPDYAGQILVSFSNWPQPVNPQRAEVLMAQRKQLGIPVEVEDSQLRISAMAELIKYLLIETGRDLSREKLTTQSKKLFEYQTGYIQGLTFHENRKVGGQGVYITQYDASNRNYQLKDFILVAQ